MGELYACLKKFYACFNCFDIEQSIAETNQVYISLGSLAQKEYERLCLVPLK